MRPVLAACLALCLAAGPAIAAEPPAVALANHSVPTLCAEEDNVDIRLSSLAVRRFRIEAVHPAAIGTIVRDITAPDFTDCTITDREDFRFTPRDVVMFENERLRVLGITFDKFWRPEQVPFSIAGGRTESGFHLVQLYRKEPGRAPYEFLVLYPVDGYWRLKPQPPEHLSDIVYGTSALIGPIEVMQRPVVNLSAIRFDPASETFSLSFRAGGSAEVRVVTVDRERTTLEVAFDRPVEGRPFAGFRSMYVTETNADSARMEWRERGGRRWRESPVMDFAGAEAIEMRLGRSVPSRHNTSAPDHRVFGFSE